MAEYIHVALWLDMIYIILAYDAELHFVYDAVKKQIMTFTLCLQVDRVVAKFISGLDFDTYTKPFVLTFTGNITILNVQSLLLCNKDI